MELLFFVLFISLSLGIWIGSKLEAYRWYEKSSNGFRMAYRGNLYYIIQEDKYNVMKCDCHNQKPQKENK